MTEIDKATATAEPPGGSDNKPPALLMSPPPKKIENDQRSQSGSSGAGTGAAGPGASTAGASGTSAAKKRRRRSKPRRRFKPYAKLTFEEQMAKDARETAKAEQRRAAQFNHGRAMAPYNTTQFLMEDIEARNHEPDIAALVEKLNDRSGSRERTYSGTGSFDSEEPGGSWASPSDDDESSFDLDAEFDAQYETVHVERLESLSKSQLIENVIGLEADVSRAGVETRELRQMVARLRADNYTLRKTLREAGLAEVRPNSAPPPPTPAPVATSTSSAPPADPDHATAENIADDPADANTDTSSSRNEESAS